MRCNIAGCRFLAIQTHKVVPWTITVSIFDTRSRVGGCGLANWDWLFQLWATLITGACNASMGVPLRTSSRHLLFLVLIFLPFPVPRSFPRPFLSLLFFVPFPYSYPPVIRLFPPFSSSSLFLLHFSHFLVLAFLIFLFTVDTASFWSVFKKGLLAQRQCNSCSQSSAQGGLRVVTLFTRRDFCTWFSVFK